MTSEDTQIFKNCLEAAEGVSESLWVDSSSSFNEWMAGKKIPGWLRTHLLSSLLKNTTSVGVAYYYTPEEIVKRNDEFPEVMEQGYLIIGSAADGDPLVVCMKENLNAVGYLNHETLWSGLRLEFFPVATSVGSYAVLAAAIVGCPIDFYGTLVE